MTFRAWVMVLMLGVLDVGCGAAPRPGCQGDCAGRVCGDDGCGGVCGSCPSGQTCGAGSCRINGCKPTCGGAQCGSDGCGGSCGICSNGVQCVNGTCQNPVPHNLASAMPETFSNFYGFEFVLPVEARVSFTVGEATTDTWNVALFTPTEWTSWQDGSGNQATAAVHNNVMSASDSATLPAGNWYLGFKCTNFAQRCMIAFNLSATY